MTDPDQPDQTPPSDVPTTSDAQTQPEGAQSEDSARTEATAQPDGTTEPDGTVKRRETDAGSSRFVVPDPGSPTDGEPTTFIPPAGTPPAYAPGSSKSGPVAGQPPEAPRQQWQAPRQQQWQPPGEHWDSTGAQWQPAEQTAVHPTQPPPGTGQAPGTPPGPGTGTGNDAGHQRGYTTQQPWSSGYPQSPPTAPPGAWGPGDGPVAPAGGWATTAPGGPQQSQTGSAQYPPAQHPQTQYPPAQYQQQPPPTDQPTKRSGRTAAIVIGVLIVVLFAVGAVFGFRALRGSSSPFDGTVDRCHIASDGALTASGTVTSDEELDETLEVRFEDTATGDEVDRTTVDVRGSGGEQVPWSANGQAPEEVNRVTCTLGPAD